MLGAQASLCVQAELSLLGGALRRAPPHEPEQAALARDCARLAGALRKPEASLAPPEWLPPFLAVVRSERTAAAPTAMALAALHKFLSCGFLDPTHPSTSAAVENIADAVTHARFVGTDHSSDGVVLMKILQVLRTLMLSPEGALLTGDSVCDIMLSCFRICFETRLSEILRLNADQCLRDMIRHVFMRLPQFTSSSVTSEDVTDSDQNGPNAIDYESSQRNNGAPVNLSATANLSEECFPMDLNNSGENSERSRTVSVDSENVGREESLSHSNVRSPSKKHGRHSSMDLSSNDTIYISQLVEKCVVLSETVKQAAPSEETKNEIEIGDTKVENLPDNSDSGQVCAGETISPNPNYDVPSPEEENVAKDYVNPRGVRFIAYDEQANLLPYGVPCVKELFRFLISLCNPLDTQNNSSMVHLGLCLIETALEVAADNFAQHPTILQLIKDSLCRNLLSLLNSDRVFILAIDLQVSFLLFESLRTHLKFQMESFFIKLIEIVMSDNTKNSYESKEITYLAVESIAQMWRIPGLCTELYLNYDCDIYCSNLFEDITKLLSKSIVATGFTNYQTLALDAYFSVIESIEMNCDLTKLDKKEDDSVIDVDMDSSKKYIAIDMESCDENHDPNIRNISQYISSGDRHKISSMLPSLQQLQDVKNRKRWIATGTEHFNQKPEKGIEYLQEHGILSVPLDPLEIANFLKLNPGLDKKMIGEYISKKKNVESRILATYAASFDMTGLRIDQALRLYLETFRLPGEAPLIFLVMEHFAEHWHNCNGQPFANTDAAFRLAYAVIMLNMDQHNHNAKKLNIPMTIEDFVRNLRGCNGNGDFDQPMLEAVFNSIKNEEIVMPAERTGIVKENYLWKVLLRRGLTKEGIFHHCPSGIYDIQLFTAVWGPLIAALSSIFEKSHDSELYTRAIDGFEKCASIVGHHLLTNELDTLILSLCKFSGLLNLPEQAQYIYISATLGQSNKAQLALRKVFSICHRHADSIREGWKPVLEVLLALFKGHLLPKCLTEADDFCSPSGKISLINEPSQQAKTHEPGILSSLYSYIALSSESNSLRNPNPEEAELIEIASDCISQCNIDTLLLTDSKFLQLDSLQELVKYIITAGKVPENQMPIKFPNDDPVMFFLELLIKIVIQNRDRVSHVWTATEGHVVNLMKTAAESTQIVLTDKFSNSNTTDRMSLNINSRYSSNLLERSSTGLLKLAINLMRNEECASDVLHSLKSFLDLNYPVYHHIACQIAIGLFELVKTSAQNIHSAEDWSLVFILLETTGAGAMHLKQDELIAGSKSDGAISSEDESVSTDRGYTSEGELSQSPPSQGWILVGKDGAGGQTPNPGVIQNTGAPINPLVHPCALRPHDPHALLKCWECLAFIVRDVAHITPYNFESCVNCIRTFVEASLHGTNQGKITTSHLLNTKEKRKRQTNNIKRMQKQYEDTAKRLGKEGRDAPEGYQLISIQLLDLMHTLHSRTAQIFKWWREEANFNPNINSHEFNQSGAEWCNLWHLAWQPLLQGIARLCTDSRKQVCNSAVTYLQRALLVHDLQTLSGEEWEACFHSILFPLLSQLTNHHDDIRLRANTIMCKVFLHHLTPLLGRPSFSSLWLSLLDLMRSLMTGSNTTDLLYEATLESLKNMLLVMDSVKVFNDGEGYSELWNITWDRINTFLPKLKNELFKPSEHYKPQVESMSNEISLTNFADAQMSQTVSPVSASASFIENKNLNLANVAPMNAEYQKPILNNSATLQNPSTMNVPQIPNCNIQNFNPPIPTGLPGRSSIILQPPNSQVHSPLFTHLGQMVSTPIGVAVPVSGSLNTMQTYPILCPAPIPPKYYNNQMNPPIAEGVALNSLSASAQGATTSQFTIISPQSAAPPRTNTGLSYRLESAKSHNKSIPEGDPELKDRPSSIFGEYLTNPYNLYSNNPIQSAPTTIMEGLESQSASVLHCDNRPNRPSAEGLIQKSQSVTSSPLRAASQTVANFGSSDNIKNISIADGADSSGMFSYSKYFYSDSTEIPPGSEILYGENPNPPGT